MAFVERFLSLFGSGLRRLNTILNRAFEDRRVTALVLACSLAERVRRRDSCAHQAIPEWGTVNRACREASSRERTSALNAPSRDMCRHVRFSSRARAPPCYTAEMNFETPGAGIRRMFPHLWLVVLNQSPFFCRQSWISLKVTLHKKDLTLFRTSLSSHCLWMILLNRYDRIISQRWENKIQPSRAVYCDGLIYIIITIIIIICARVGNRIKT